MLLWSNSINIIINKDKIGHGFDFKGKIMPIVWQSYLFISRVRKKIDNSLCTYFRSYIFYSDPDPVRFGPDSKICAVAAVVYYVTIVANGWRNVEHGNMLRSTLVTLCNMKLYFLLREAAKKVI